MKKFVVVFIVLALLLVAIPASASRMSLPNACDELQNWSAYAPYNQNTIANTLVGSVAIQGVVYKNGSFYAFSTTLVKPSSGTNSYAVGGGVVMHLGYDGNLFFYNGSPNYQAEVSTYAVIMHMAGGRCAR